MLTMSEMRFEIGDVVLNIEDDEVGVVDGVSTTQDHFSYAIDPFTGHGKCAWFEPDELKLIERGPAWAHRHRYYLKSVCELND